MRLPRWSDFIAGILAAGLTLSGGQPTPLSSADFNPGPVVPQDCQPHRFTAWTNTTGRPVQLAAVDSWMGIYRGAYADVTIVLYRVSDGTELSSLRQDRYADPSEPHQRFVAFPGDGFTLAPGDSIWLDGLNCHVGGWASPMHPEVTLYFR